MKIKNPTLFQVEALPMRGPKGEPQLTVIVKGTFAFGSGGSDVADEQLPIAYGDIYKDKNGAVYYESDIVPMKPCTDIVLDAAAMAPDQRPAEVVSVAVKVGKTEKKLAIFGDRFWNHTAVLGTGYTMTRAKPFLEKPIVYEDAFGGIDKISGAYCAENLVGKGLYSDKSGNNLAGKPLPGVENPRQLIRSIEDRPRPVGFGFYGRAWQPRAAYAGTYDRAWCDTRAPQPPEDFNPRFYNGAHPDLQVDGYLNGDEPVMLRNLTPEGETAFRLPGIRMYCRVNRKHENGHPEKEDMTMNLDTLFMEPGKKRFCLVWRAWTGLEDLSASEVAKVAIGWGEIKNVVETKGVFSQLLFQQGNGAERN